MLMLHWVICKEIENDSLLNRSSGLRIPGDFIQQSLIRQTLLCERSQLGLESRKSAFSHQLNCPMYLRSKASIFRLGLVHFSVRPDSHSGGRSFLHTPTGPPTTNLSASGIAVDRQWALHKSAVNNIIYCRVAHDYPPYSNSFCYTSSIQFAK